MDTGVANNYVTRDEKILCLGHNTFRFNDYPLAKEIYELNDIKESFNKMMFFMIQRKSHIIGEEIGVDKEVFESFKYKTYVSMYKDAPYTPIYRMMQNLKIQRFINSITIMYNTFGGNVDVSSLVEDGYKTCSYSGDISEIETYIAENSITTLICDDVSIVYQLVNREIINVNGMTFMISKLGYNFDTKEENKVHMKYEELIDIMTISKNFEFAFIDMWEFTQDDMDEINMMG